jgi:hypothetical protein
MKITVTLGPSGLPGANGANGDNGDIGSFDYAILIFSPKTYLKL